jgi:GntR family transcriptional regulator/MocR family aminotransferase
MLRILLEPGSKMPLYEQIYQHIKVEIKNGTLPTNTKLPSTRTLSNNLAVSRNTVDLAYSQLLSEGYITSKPKSGYYVCLVADLPNITLKSTPMKNIEPKEKTNYLYDFSPFTIDINNFPFHTWKRLSKEAMSVTNHELFLLGCSQGDENLRVAIAEYLRSFRSVNCNTDQIIIGAGSDYLLQLLCQLLTRATNDNSDVIAMENPTYMRAYHIFKGFSYQVEPIALDKYGIHIESLTKSKANIVYVTPSHQYPLGIIMPITRRLELLNWASEAPSRYIIEDDHDSEFRYKGKPIPSLQGIDSDGTVIYLGTFSRALTPALRIAYMVLPDKLFRIYKEHFSYYSSTVSRVDQHILAEFIMGGYFERHLNKMRTIYKSKHDLLIQLLKIFGDKIEIEGENAGLHLVLRFHTKLSEEEIIKIASEHQIKLYSLSKHYIASSHPSSLLDEYSHPTFLLGYANISEEVLRNGIRCLYEVLKDIL